jgi:hypothetical protein
MWGVGGVHNQFVYGTFDSSLSCNGHGPTFYAAIDLYSVHIPPSALQINVLLISSTQRKLTQAVMGNSKIHSHLPKRGICK